MIPWYMKSLLAQAQRTYPKDKTLAANEEITLYYKLTQSIRALIIGCEALMKPMTAQHRRLEGVTSLTAGHKKDLDETVMHARLVVCG